MQIELRINSNGLPDLVRPYVERRLRFALSRFGNRVGHILVRVAVNGRGENSCRITAEVLSFGRLTTLAIEESGPDLFAAIDRATGRIGHLCAREIERTRQSRTGRDSVRLAA